MRLKFFVPEIGAEPDGRPERCPECGCEGLSIHQHVKKKVIDHKFEEINATRYKCKACGCTFRWYPKGVCRDIQGAAVKAMGVILYVLGLSYDKVSSFLNAVRLSSRRGFGLRDR